MGLIPDSEMQIVLGLRASALARKYARRAAANGCDPAIAVLYGKDVGMYTTYGAVIAIITGIPAFFALAGGGLLTLWGFGQLAWIFYFGMRLSRFKSPSHDPSKTMPRTRLAVLVFVLVVPWALVGVAGVLQAGYNASQYPTPAPTVQTVPNPQAPTSGALS